METEYLIVGNSAGGIGAAEAIRSVDGKGRIIIVSDEPYPVYSRPLISEYLAGERDMNGIIYRPYDFYERSDVVTMFCNKVVELDIEGKAAILEGGETVFYRKLLLACGGAPIFPPLDGSGKEGVFTFTRLDDARAIEMAVGRGARKAVVIGAGLIGISVTEALRKLGIEVTIVELMDRILGAVLGEEASAMVREKFEVAEVEFRTGCTVETILGRGDDDSSVGGVVLDDGEQIGCDMVIVAIGVVPRLDLVRETNIKVNRGVLVDRNMATSDPDVYSCGDMAEAYDFIYGANRVVPVWPSAHIGGRIAGYNMAGRPAEYPGGTAMNSLKYFGLPITSAGMVNPLSDSGEYEILSRRDEGRYQKFVLREGKLVGMVMVRDIERAGIYYGLMRDGVNIGDCTESLLSDEFGLISLPEDLLRKRLELPDLGRLHLLDEPGVARKVAVGV